MAVFGKSFDIKNPLNFSLIYSNSFPATPIRNDRGEIIDYLPITEIIIPSVLHIPICAVNVSTAIPVGRIWRYAGKISRILDMGLGEAFSSDERKHLFLGRWNICFFDKELSADYRIVYLPPRWFINVNVSVYQYEGEYSDSLMDAISNINTKLEQLTNQ